jgi:phosphatidylserine/phosphatidylglycerophosphate/cardiolipin synthase-like enzyme
VARIIDALDDAPPRGLLEARPLFIQPTKLNTARLMHDPRVTDQSRWFDTSGVAHPVRANNEVTYLVRGKETFQHMADAIRSASRPGAFSDSSSPPFIYLVGWTMADTPFKLIPGDPSSSIESLFTAASNAGVEIRVMLWANATKGPGVPVTHKQVQFFNRLPTGRAILDDKTGVFLKFGVFPPVSVLVGDVIIRRGAHHQKMLIVNGAGGLVAFCGGVDIFNDRMDAGEGGDSLGLHDVHCKMRGAAAEDLLLVFRQRWDDYINGPDTVDSFPTPLRDSHHDPEKPAVSTAELVLRNVVTASLPFFKPPPSTVGDMFVQVGRTFHSRLYHRFAPKGEQTTKQMVLRAISQAQRFIYMEEQYLVNMETSDALKAAIAKDSFKHLIILIPDDGGLAVDFFGQAPFRRAKFIKNLTSAPGGNKVRVLTRDRYVHAKIYIIDDCFAIIGSANCNRRGWEHDSEAICAMTDQSSDEHAALHFARRLRMRLWADHLNLQQKLGIGNVPLNPNLPLGDDDDFSELADGVASAIHWINIPPNSHIRPYTVDDDFNKALVGLQRLLFSGSEPANPPPGVGPAIGRAVASFLAGESLLINVQTVEALWDQLIDPASPVDP